MNFIFSGLLKYYKTLLIAIIVFFIFGALLLLLRHDIEGKKFHIYLSLIAAYYSFQFLRKGRFNDYQAGTLIGLSVLFFLTIINHTIQTIHSDQQFDFLCFYMQGQLGLHHLPFYEADSFKILLERNNYPFNFNQALREEILDVGLLSPPITMLLFAPLSSFDYNTSRTFFSLIIFISIIINSLLANKIFLEKNERSIFSFLFIFLIMVINPATASTIGYVQTNHLLLFLLLLAYYKTDHPVSGFFVALSTIIKPISGILFLYFLVNSRWKSALYFVITLIFLFILTSYMWGVDNIIDFIKSPPSKRLPSGLYIQDINQSMIAIFNRNLPEYGFSQKTINFLYFTVCTAMTVITIFVSRKLHRSDIRLSFLSFIPLMLIVYPSSLSYYAVYLAPVFIYFALIKRGEAFFWAMILPAFFFLNNEAFYSYLISWIGLMFIGIYIHSYSTYRFARIFAGPSDY